MPLQVLKELYHSDSRGDEIQQLSGAVTVTDTCINYMIDSVLIKPGIDKIVFVPNPERKS